MRGNCIAISLAISFISLLSSLGLSGAETLQPWCWDGTANSSGELECAYKSFQQCLVNKPDVGDCLANPAIDPVPRYQQKR
jgi:hypothetical protein